MQSFPRSIAIINFVKLLFALAYCNANCRTLAAWWISSMDSRLRNGGASSTTEWISFDEGVPWWNNAAASWISSSLHGPHGASGSTVGICGGDGGGDAGGGEVHEKVVDETVVDEKVAAEENVQEFSKVVCLVDDVQEGHTQLLPFLDHPYIGQCGLYASRWHCEQTHTFCGQCTLKHLFLAILTVRLHAGNFETILSAPSWRRNSPNCQLTFDSVRLSRSERREVVPWLLKNQRRRNEQNQLDSVTVWETLTSIHNRKSHGQSSFN